jgi:uncharacterized protein (DUF433 family)
MSTKQAVASHVVIGEDGIARIDDLRTKVYLVVLDHVVSGWSAEVIHERHDYLSLAQIHAALSYYYDHKEDFDRQLAEDELEDQRLWEADQDSPLRKRLRAGGLI